MNIIDTTIDNLQKALSLARKIRSRQSILKDQEILPKQQYIVSKQMEKDIKELDRMLANMDTKNVEHTIEISKPVRNDMVIIAEDYYQ